jgi:hypothetical protein
MRLNTGKMVITHSLTIVGRWVTFVCLDSLNLAGEVRAYCKEKDFQVRHFRLLDFID